MANKAFGMPEPNEAGVIPGSTESQKLKVALSESPDTEAVDKVRKETTVKALDVFKSGGLNAHSPNFRDADHNVC